MSKKTITAEQVATAVTKLTKQGRESMEAIGRGQVSFFDGGIKEDEGSWGQVLTGDLGHKSSGVLNGLKRQGLFENHGQQGDNIDAGDWWVLTALGAAVANHLAEQPESAALPAEEPAAAESTVEPEFAADATKDWRGNYNTVFAPGAELIASGSGVEVRTVNVSTMLKQTDLAGATAKDVVALLSEVEEQAVAALKTWQKTQDRKEQTDMEKYNQNRSFLSGYLGAVAQGITGAKKIPAVVFAKDMGKALRPEAQKAGAAARKAEVAA
jgi:hypothetical protein